ncbi:MAG: RraA family protein [Firmicutes bacterium]|nr:RraA family protein [Bacillota bacterium]
MTLAEQKEALDYLATLQSGVVTDALVRLGLGGWMDYVLPMQPKGRLVGRAVTVKYAPKRGTGGCKENLYSIIRQSKPGDVLVIEALGTDCWILGENVTHTALYSKLAGIVIDGRVRDAAEIREMALPVFCRGASVRPHAPFMELVDYNVPIRCAGAQVHPGDIIVGDADGIVVAPSAKLAEVMVQVRDIDALEKEQEEAIAQGKSLEVLGEILRRTKIKA